MEEIDKFTPENHHAITCEMQYGSTKYIHHFTLTEGQNVTGYSECTDRDWTGVSTLREFKLVANVEFKGKQMKYHPGMNENGSEMRRELSQKICEHLDEIRADGPVKKDFQTECQLLQVHPITNEAIVKVSVQEIHLTSFGFTDDNQGLARFTQRIFKEEGRQLITYNARLLFPDEEVTLTYQTIFIKGILRDAKGPISVNQIADLTSKTPYVQLNETVCSEIRRRSSENSVLGKLSIHCVIDRRDSNSNVLMQLSVSDRSLITLNIHPEQRIVEKLLIDLFGRTPLRIHEENFQPELVTTCSSTDVGK
ncbi:hypothetical protein FGIG_00031 [Fasciola gigantica]|uniref:Uncharacterized protein n=1 Tax=Fasciola gigantica TaxID=46835 RepID=A0A504XNJ4_FASGI|nr:hypothetical protein FGIG_00031 [Fasciola gigantica]